MELALLGIALPFLGLADPWVRSTVEATVILEALAITVSDLIGALLILSAVAVVLWAIARNERNYLEERVAETAERVETEAKEEDWDWPRRKHFEAQTDFDERKAA